MDYCFFDVKLGDIVLLMFLCIVGIVIVLSLCLIEIIVILSFM